MWLFFAAAWVSVVGALCFVWFHRRKRAFELADISGEVAGYFKLHAEALERRLELPALTKRLDVMEQRATRLELRANIRSQP